MVTLFWLGIALLMEAGNCSKYNCTFFVNGNMSWMAVYEGFSASGTAQYFADGSMMTLDPDGNTINRGMYEIIDGPEYCYINENFSYPANASNSCNSYYVMEEDKSMIGCNGEFSNSCKPYRNCNGHWDNWFALRLVNYL